MRQTDIDEGSSSLRHELGDKGEEKEGLENNRKVAVVVVVIPVVIVIFIKIVIFVAIVVIGRISSPLVPFTVVAPPPSL